MGSESLPKGVSGPYVMFDDGYALNVGAQAAQEIRMMIAGQITKTTVKWCQKKRREEEAEIGRRKFGSWYDQYADALERAKG